MRRKICFSALLLVLATPANARNASDSMRSPWIETRPGMPSGSLPGAPPGWQGTERERATYAGVWVGAGAIVFAAGLVVLFGIRQGYDAPRHLHAAVSGDGPPDALSPALAGTLASRGRPSLEHAAATLLVLADRGALRVEESDSRTLGTRTYHLTRGSDRTELAPHEEAVLAAVYGGNEMTVTLAKARRRLLGGSRRFARTVVEELDAAGLIDHERQKVRRTYLRIMIIEFVLALGAFAAWPFLMKAHGAWPLAIFMGLTATGLVSLLAYGTATPLTNEGVEQGRQWRAYRNHLKALANQKSEPPGASSLAYPIALGLATEWAKRLKQHPIDAPPWFQSKDAASAYPMFIAAAGAGAHGNSPPHHAH